MASELTLIIPRSTVWHLHNATKAQYTGTGTPWTSASTTPFRLANADTTGPQWAPKAAPPVPQYSGGPPFISRTTLVAQEYADVDEIIPLHVYASSHDNAAAAIRVLRQQLTAALALGPCYLGWKPNGATNTLYYEITAAQIQENPRSLNDELPTHAVRCQLTCHRSALGGHLSTSATPVTAAAVASTSFGNAPNSATPNIRAFANVSGDLAYSGQPLNLRIAQGSFTNTNAERAYIASILAQQYDNVDAATTRSTTSTTGVIAASYEFNVTSYIGTDGVRPRVLFALDNPTAILEVRAVVRTGGSSSTGTIIYTSGWQAAGGSDNLFDMGMFAVDALRDIYRDAEVTQVTNLTVEFWIRSTSGGSASAKLLYTSLLWYYEFCTISTTWADAPYDYLVLQTFANRQHYLAAPLQVPRCTVIEEDGSSDAPATLAVVRGEYPKARVGASLWIGWVGDGGYVSTETVTITARTAAQWFTLRGAA
jgi:hypothetical protein